jgi:hypothetical protein
MYTRKNEEEYNLYKKEKSIKSTCQAALTITFLFPVRSLVQIQIPNNLEKYLNADNPGLSNEEDMNDQCTIFISLLQVCQGNHGI